MNANAGTHTRTRSENVNNARSQMIYTCPPSSPACPSSPSHCCLSSAHVIESISLLEEDIFDFWKREKTSGGGGLTFKNVKMGVNGSEAERSLSESAERELGESKYEKYWRGGEKWKKQRHRAQRTMGAHSLSSHVRPKAQREPRVVNHQSCSPAPALHELAYTRSNKQQELLQVLPSNFRVKFLSLL